MNLAKFLKTTIVQTAASAINIDAKYSQPSHQLNASINSAKKPCYQLQRRGVPIEMSEVMGLAYFESQ